MTGTYKNTKISSPGNQMFVAFETTLTVAKRGFKASIIENSIWYNNYFASVHKHSAGASIVWGAGTVWVQRHSGKRYFEFF